MVLDTGEYWAAEDFQLEIAEDLFSGVPEVWVVIPEGNAKTTLMSGLGLYHGDFTPTAEVLLAAASRDQAGLLFSQAAGFVSRSPGFSNRFRVFEGYRRVKCLNSGGRLQVMAADDRTGDGVIPTLALIDEPHRARSLALVRTWRGKLQKRDGQLGLLSTAGEPGTEFEDARARMLGEAPDVRVDGFHIRAATEDAILHDFSVPAGEDVSDMAVVKKANPLSAITVETLEKKRRSKLMTDAHWRRFVCNQPVRDMDTAVTPVEWAEQSRNKNLKKGTPVWLGVDFGWKHDTTAIVPLHVKSFEDRRFGRPAILTPPRDGSFLEPALVKQAFRDMFDRYQVQGVVMDPDRAAEIATWIRDELGVEPAIHGQGVEMFDAYEQFMEALRNKWLWHPGDSEFTEHVLNAVAKISPDGKTRFDRPSSSRSQQGQRRRVIDALIAAAMVNRAATATQKTVTPMVGWVNR